MSDATVTVVGRLTAKPTFGHTKHHDVFANFDVAVNHGYYDRERQMYIETGVSFFSVSTFRNLAINVIESLDKGTPVVVSGRLRLVKWESNDKQGMTARIEANAVGPDLTWGQADFTNLKRPRLEGNDRMDDPAVLEATSGPGQEGAAADVTDQAGPAEPAADGTVPPLQEAPPLDPEDYDEEAAEDFDGSEGQASAVLSA